MILLILFNTKLKIEYTQLCLFQGKQRRRKKLNDKWYFSCCCERCSSPTELGTHTSTLKCQEKGVVSTCHGNILTTIPNDICANWRCETCHHEISPEKLLEMENKLANTLKDCIHTSFENVEKTIQELSNHLHTNHYIYILAKRHLIRMYGLDMSTQETEKLILREKLCQEVRNLVKL